MGSEQSSPYAASGSGRNTKTDDKSNSVRALLAGGIPPNLKRKTSQGTPRARAAAQQPAVSSKATLSARSKKR